MWKNSLIICPFWAHLYLIDVLRPFISPKCILKLHADIFVGIGCQLLLYLLHKFNWFDKVTIETSRVRLCFCFCFFSCQTVCEHFLA